MSPGITTTYTVDGNSNGCLGNSVITLIVDPCVGIKEYDLSYLKIYPNPTINNLNITNENNSFENSTIEIMNYLSQTIFKQSYSNTIDVLNYQLVSIL